MTKQTSEKEGVPPMIVLRGSVLRYSVNLLSLFPSLFYRGPRAARLGSQPIGTGPLCSYWLGFKQPSSMLNYRHRYVDTSFGSVLHWSDVHNLKPYFLEKQRDRCSQSDHWPVTVSPLWDLLIFNSTEQYLVLCGSAVLSGCV